MAQPRARVELRLTASAKIAYEGPAPAVADLLDDLRRYKNELLDLLAARNLPDYSKNASTPKRFHNFIR
jgi:hypothetical protein